MPVFNRTAPSSLTAIPRVLSAFAASLALVVATSLTPPALAQDQAPPAQTQAQDQPAAAQLLTAEQLDQLVAPIALYPDDLIAQILTASTYPLETVMAARWSAANPNMKGQQLEDAMQQQNWDPSVKALATVPQVLAMMNDKLDWTQQLGDAYLAQPDDVASAIQRLRLKAQAAGNLQTTAQQRVRRVPAPQPIIIEGTPEPDYVVIEPVDPDVYYVPVYNPVVVFGPWAYPAYPPFFWSPPGFVVAGVIGFGVPCVVGPAIWAHYDWASRHVNINVVNYNRFNRTTLSNTATNQVWQHDPAHRGNIPYNNAAVQQKFGRAAATSNAGVNPNPQRTNLVNPGNANPINPRAGTTPLNSNAITNINRNGAVNATTTNNNPKVNRNSNLQLNNPNTPKGPTGNNGPARTTDLKADKGANLEQRRVNNAVVHTNPTNTAIRNNPTNNVVRNPTPNNVVRNVQNVPRNNPPPRPASNPPPRPSGPPPGRQERKKP